MIDAVRLTGLALKGPLATPLAGGSKSLNVTLRKAFELFANVRPARQIPGLAGRYADQRIDMVVVRENVEDLYAGVEHQQTPDMAQSLKLISREGSRRVARFAFAYASQMRRKKVTCATKSNILKLTEGLFQKTFEAEAAGWPTIEADHMLIDACAHALVRDPSKFDVLLATNMNGDIVSDLAAGLVGGLGVAPSANIGHDAAVFEPVHGSAPDIAGQGKANPTAAILAAAMMLRHIGATDAAADIEFAVDEVYREGRWRTPDVVENGKACTTDDFADAVIDALSGPYGPSEWRRPAEIRRTPPLDASRTRGFDGVDVFVEWRGDVERLAKLMQDAAAGCSVKLSLISNRGVQVYPDIGARPAPSDHWRVRFRTAEPKGEEPNAELGQLLVAIGIRCRWTQIEKLLRVDGAPAYSKALGET